MNISILIPVSSDLMLKRCIDSIDEKVEVVISLNKPTKEVLEQVEHILYLKRSKKSYPGINFKICKIEEASIAKAYNNGINHASQNLVLLMDSDCTFKKGTIRKLAEGIKGCLLSKGRVEFLHNSRVSRIVAKAREFHTSDTISAYSPPLLIRKEVSRHIGNYYFDPALCWTEDNEFDSRVQMADLHIQYDESAVVQHPTLSIARDLKSAFWYGVGECIGVEIGVYRKPRGFIKSIKKYIVSASKTKGLAAGFYLYIWKSTLLIGYYAQKLFRLRQH
ncbi:MAG: glycosyltransferase [bacterium]|nr:glycosyltransferase [bacterium]